MTVLLDTHVFLWLLGDPERVAADVRAQLADRSTRLLVSAASALEVATKTRLGKLPAGAAVVSTWPARVEALGCDELSVTTAHALVAGTLAWPHRDPFDRLLVAQALLEPAVLATHEPVMLQAPGVRTMPV
jgi:PIN domain nuclease of toxin-antitoxin system